MENIYLDTDVIIDFLVDNPKHAENMARLFTYADQGKLVIHIAALSFSNIYYVTRKFVGKTRSLELLHRLDKLVNILPVDEQIIRQALVAGFSDFEDAIQNYTAKQLKEIRTIVTRNTRDYAKSDLAIHTPESYLKLFEQSK